MNEKVLKFVFGEGANHYIKISNMIINGVENTKYEYYYLTQESFMLMSLKNGIGWTNQYICKEILQRVYFATVSGYLRQHSWIKSVCLGIETDNYLAFASSLRGYLEAATDLYDALYNVPLTLAGDYKVIMKAISGEITDSIISTKELEEALLHFQEARKNINKKDFVNTAKSAKAYMENKHLSSLNLYQCYGELCEITHPAKNSLDLFIDEKDYKYTFKKKDSDLIKDFLSRYHKQFSELFMLTDNLCIIILKSLNLFKVHEYYSESVDSINTSSIGLWKIINDYIR